MYLFFVQVKIGVKPSSKQLMLVTETRCEEIMFLL
jgi:hypothetical protein